MLIRYIKILRYKNALNDVLHAYFDFKDVNFRYIFMPLENIPSNSIPISFDPKSMK